MLLELRDYLVRQQTASLQQMAWHFKLPPETVRGCLQHWVRKGKVCRLDSGGCGSKCQLCQPEKTEVYRWNMSSDYSDT